MSLTIALDGMGGDNAPQSVIDGAALACERLSDAKFIVFGDEQRLKPLIDRKPALNGRLDIGHTSETVSNTDKPSIALRTKKKSSMRLALDAVRDGVADCCVSSGNTGALMAMAIFSLGLIPGIRRPAIGTFFPTLRGKSCMLDLGANVESDAKNLVQFAVMGEVFARTVIGVERPTIGLLNVGVEELKGREELRQAATALKKSSLPIEFHGFIEGNDILSGIVDVIVTDGFTGNVVLKALEGAESFSGSLIREAFRSSIMARIGCFLALPALNGLKKKLDHRQYNGAMLLGLDGVAVKSHGSTDGIGFSHAMQVAADMITCGFRDKMQKDLEFLANLDLSSGEK